MGFNSGLKGLKKTVRGTVGSDDHAQSFVEVTECISSYGRNKTIINRSCVSDISPFWNMHKYKVILNNNVVNWIYLDQFSCHLYS